jgi:DNA-binding LacI/PurR family transcriptional regulator
MRACWRRSASLPRTQSGAARLGRAGSETADALLARLLSYQVDRVMVASATLPSGIATRCASSCTPIVLVDRRAGEHGREAPRVGADTVGGRCLVADSRAAAGHRRHAFLAGIKATLISTERERGLVAGLAAPSGRGARYRQISCRLVVWNSARLPWALGHAPRMRTRRW